MDLREAIDKAAILYDYHPQHPIPVKIALEKLGYKADPPSGTALRTLAALSHYGLIETEGQLSERKVRVSELGRSIIIDKRPDSEERKRRIREAALKPTLFVELWQNYGGSLPPDDTLSYELERDGTLNRNVIGEFLATFRSTLKFAGLEKGAILATDGGAKQIAIEEEEEDEGMQQEERNQRESQRGQRGKQPMPATTLQDRSDLDLPIPLIEGGQATLRIPVPLTEEDYEYLTGMLDNMLKGMKKALTRRPKPNASDDDD
jgi:hypothetical protein